MHLLSMQVEIPSQPLDLWSEAGGYTRAGTGRVGKGNRDGV